MVRGHLSFAEREDVTAWPTCVLAEWFDAALFSFEIGLAKPDPAIYLEAVECLGAEPADALFIGDGGDDELAGAERAGLRAVQATWFDDAAVRPRRSAGVSCVSAWPEVVQLVGSG